MKRARPKNKKAAAKRAKKLEKQMLNEAAERRGETYTEPVGRKKSPRGKRKRRPLKIILTTLVVFVILIVASMGLGVFDTTDLLLPIADGKINVLMMGVDEDGLRTDAIMVASYNVETEQLNMLSIPRDTKMYVENRDMTRKMTEIHAISSKTKTGQILGAEATAEAVYAITGIPINYYVEFSFSAIDALFEQLGPVEFDVPDVEGKGRGMNYDDPVQNLHIHLKPGLQELSGNQIQQFLRYRKSNSGAGSGSDTDRVARQQEFVKAVVDQKLTPALLVKLPGIYGEISKLIKTNISVGDITKYVRYLNKLTSENISSFSLPGENKTINKVSYFVCNKEETAALMSERFGYNNEIKDSVTLSEKSSQKPLKAGNTAKKDASKGTSDDTSKDTSKNTSKDTAQKDSATSKTTSSGDKTAGTSKPASEPTKAPDVTKAPEVTKAPVVTKSSVKDPDPTPIPLEEIGD